MRPSAIYATVGFQPFSDLPTLIRSDESRVRSRIVQPYVQPHPPRLNFRTVSGPFSRFFFYVRAMPRGFVHFRISLIPPNIFITNIYPPPPSTFASPSASPSFFNHFLKRLSVSRIWPLLSSPATHPHPLTSAGLLRSSTDQSPLRPPPLSRPPRRPVPGIRYVPLPFSY